MTERATKVLATKLEVESGKYTARNYKLNKPDRENFAFFLTYAVREEYRLTSHEKPTFWTASLDVYSIRFSRSTVMRSLYIVCAIVRPVLDLSYAALSNS